MKQDIAEALSKTLKVKVNVTEKGLTYEADQPREMKTALRNIEDAIKHLEMLAALNDGGKQFRVMNRLDPADQWTYMGHEFDLCNEAVIQAATLNMDPSQGEIQVYDCRTNREMLYLPPGGMN